ncbi:TM0106 family RecB-like putative nuclease [Actinokineospora bangkokensis]|uniref:ATPase n=1 Tax=Actinokineospora bangkokensis TaxID=1193682 RepID=A0A1Q9LKG0_9PSEU|nr:TM0106 family RecB-like putative nuclease [Actinokineospora bangkokensis]OLR92475.1 ATPase [Actinokineospora bangkokensis]
MHTPSDLADLLDCDHRSVLTQAHRAGLPGAPAPQRGGDQLAAKHGQAHERATLGRLRERTATLVEIDERDPVLAAKETEAALRAGADVVYQAVFVDGEFSGRADFLQRDAHGRYEVYDTKLARRARPGAVIQLAAYADALRRSGHPAGPHMHLLLGDGSTETLRVDDFLPLLRRLRARLRRRAVALPARLWADERPACGTCSFAQHCADGRSTDRDLSLVAGISQDQRRKLTAAGVATIDALAAATERPASMSPGSFTALRAQAAIQVRQDATGRISYELVAPAVLAALPAPSPGDVFFDMEGDPYALDGDGLEYLFGAVTADGVRTFHPFWAHSRRQEKQAFEDFVDFATARLAEHPDAHVYHYAPYEVTAVKRLAALHGTREAQVDDLLRRGALVDLYAVVRKALRVSQRSYSIKHLEPLYMETAREGEVKTAASSIEAYEEYLTLTQLGEHERAGEVLRGIGDYNEYDCVSTLELFRFLHRVRAEHGIETVAPEPLELPDDSRAEERAAREAEIAALVGPLLDGLPEDPAEQSPDDRARALLAALVGYYRREANPAWWEFFHRMEAPLTDLESDTTCAVPVTTEVGEWVAPTGRQKKARRTVRMSTDQDRPHPFAVGDQVLLRHDGTSTEATVVAARADRLELEETAPVDAEPAGAPQAVLPGRPISTKVKEQALHDLVRQVIAALPALPAHPGVDLLRRLAPRTRRGTRLPDPSFELVETVVEAVDRLDRSVLAVQGPPGAGKTYLAARLIAHLVGGGKTVAVTSTSHKAVENVLSAALAADPAVPTAKIPKSGQAGEVAWDQPKTPRALAAWRADHPDGHLVGGTAWNLANPLLREEPFDVLLVDEAGQFALADALAVSSSATSVVLLGDPQQLPQVVQGTHPAGAEASALGHLIGAADVVPPELGYFLDETRRMHPAVCKPVSHLSYAGLLQSHPTAAGRAIEGIPQGLYAHTVEHEGNTTRSVEEAREVVRVIDSLVGRSWDDRGAVRPLTAADVLVVAPYNLQQRVVSQALAEAGHGEARVGTVDRFQGQEAPVVIATMTSSSATDLPRGLDFLLSRNRLNVALSRAQALAVLVCSPRLVEADIRTIPQMRLVSGMIGLLDAATPWP